MSTRLAARFGRPFVAFAMTVACLFVTLGDGTSVAGIQGSGFKRNAIAYGKITRFGSIYVDGVEYDTGGASFTIDGRPASESQLRIGQIVKVRAKVNDEGTSGAASEVSFESDVLGPIAEVNLAGGTLVVLGQRIRLLGDTLFDGALPLGGILGLVPGLRIQASGYPNSAGELVATRIDLAIGGSSTSRLKGVVQSLNATARTFRLGAQTVSYEEAAVPATLANGDTVFVRGAVLPGQTTLRATDVEVDQGLGGVAEERAQVAGLITRFDSVASFMLGSQRVVTDERTHFILGGQSLGPDLEVQVKGEFNAAGDLHARRVKAKSAAVAGALGAVESISAADGTLTVLGVRFRVSAATTVEDQSDQRLRSFSAADLRVGDYVEVEGAPAAGSDGTIPINTLKRVDARNRSYVEGKALDVLLPGLNVLGVRTTTTSQTRFPTGGPLASVRFALEAPGKTVRVHGQYAGNMLIAERIELSKK